jgi:hypothetical protein
MVEVGWQTGDGGGRAANAVRAGLTSGAGPQQGPVVSGGVR